MAVPTHIQNCRTWTFPTQCWTCDDGIFVFQCTCGSTVLFDDLGWPWPIHDCYLQLRGGGGHSPAPYRAPRASPQALANAQRRISATLILPEDDQKMSNVFLIVHIRRGLPKTGRINHLKSLGLNHLGIGKIKNPLTVELVDTRYDAPTKFECIIDPARFPDLSELVKNRKIVAELNGHNREGFQWWTMEEFDFFKEWDFEG